GRAAVVGAGISGIAVALLLARDGYRVDVIERRTEGETTDTLGSGQRTINFTLSGRGLRVLERLGVADDVLAGAVTLQGRMAHIGGRPVLQRYGTADATLYAIKRGDLLRVLVKAAYQESGIRLHFGHRLTGIEAGRVLLAREGDTDTALDCDFVVGADGVHSRTREHVLRGPFVDFERAHFPCGYAELTVSAEDARTLGLAPDILHCWPAKDAALVAIPNDDGSFCCCFVHQRDGQTDPRRDFERWFPALYRSAASLRESLRDAPYSGLLSTKVSRWHSGGDVVLVGDACHAVFPFYGQGMNAALEDAVALSEALRGHGDRAEAFAAFEDRRRADTEALSELSSHHFDYLREGVGSARLHSRQTIDRWLAGRAPGRWHYEYELVAHSERRYSEAHRIIRRQARIRRATGLIAAESVLAGILRGRALLTDRALPTRRALPAHLALPTQQKG
ncbi:FAD-dependent oxidoreductase, partial [Streptomyces sp. 12297]